MLNRVGPTTACRRPEAFKNDLDMTIRSDTLVTYKSAMKTTTSSAFLFRTGILLLAGLASASGQIAYTRLLPNGTLKLHQMLGNGTSDTVINFPLTQVGFPTWSQDGALLAVTAFSPSNVPSHTWNVFDITRATGAVWKVTNFTDILDPVNVSFSYTFPWYKAFSRDRSAMAVFSLTQSGGSGGSGGGVVEIPVLEIHSLTKVANPILVHVDITKNGRHHGGEGVDWSPTQNLLAAPLESSAPFLSGGGPGETTAIFLLPPTLSAVQNGLAVQATFPRADSNIQTGVLWTEHDYQPKFSPNGTGLLYVRSFQSHSLLTSLNPDPDIQSLHIMNLNTGVDSVVRTFKQGTYITTLDWSPDGTKIVFDLALQTVGPLGPMQQGNAATNQIYTIKVNGTGLTQLRGNGNGTPTWRRPAR